LDFAPGLQPPVLAPQALQFLPFITLPTKDVRAWHRPEVIDKWPHSAAALAEWVRRTTGERREGRA